MQPLPSPVLIVDPPLLYFIKGSSAGYCSNFNLQIIIEQVSKVYRLY